MKYTNIQNTDLKVSNICLGTMTFGNQNTEAEGHSQLDYALERGINFIDTAEMYAVPSSPTLFGKTEEIIGSWLSKTNSRDKIVLATKATGLNRNLSFIREDLSYKPESIRLALENSLQRLKTDYIDIYQLHWPERKTNMFGQLGFVIDKNDDWTDNILTIIETMETFKKEGKIKHFGLSNETPWGLMRFLEESKKHNLMKPITLQNPYSLLNRTLEVGLAEICYRESVGVLAYSPLAFGVLTGKFLNNQQHPKSRLALFPQFARYNSDESKKATVLYNQLAEDNNLTLTQLSLAFLQQQLIVLSTIIGATNLEQLKENIDAFETVLSDEILLAINQIHKQIQNPAP